MSQNYTEKPVSQLRAAHAARTPRTREIREFREIRENSPRRPPPGTHPDKLGYEPGMFCANGQELNLEIAPSRKTIKLK